MLLDLGFSVGSRRSRQRLQPGVSVDLAFGEGADESSNAVDDTQCRFDGQFGYLDTQPVDRQHRRHAGPRNIGDHLIQMSAKKTPPHQRSTTPSPKIQSPNRSAVRSTRTFFTSTGRHSGRRELRIVRNNLQLRTLSCSFEASMVFASSA